MKLIKVGVTMTKIIPKGLMLTGVLSSNVARCTISRDGGIPATAGLASGLAPNEGNLSTGGADMERW